MLPNRKCRHQAVNCLHHDLNTADRILFTVLNGLNSDMRKNDTFGLNNLYCSTRFISHKYVVDSIWNRCIVLCNVSWWPLQSASTLCCISRHHPQRNSPYSKQAYMIRFIMSLYFRNPFRHASWPLSSDDIVKYNGTLQESLPMFSQGYFIKCRWPHLFLVPWLSAAPQQIPKANDVGIC